MLTPKIPELDCTMEEERTRADKFAPFIRAQPRGTNAKLLRVDKSLPWIEDELNATKGKLERAARDGKTFAEGTLNNDAEVDVKAKRKSDGNSSAMRQLYSEIIAGKLRAFGAVDGLANNELDKSGIDDKIQSTVESSSSLSSTGTNLTDDSGSFLLECDRKTPKSQMNMQKKFQVSAR